MKKKNLFGLCGLAALICFGGAAAFATQNIKGASALTLGGDTNYYVYYVTNSNEETHDCVYAWIKEGGNDYPAENWPGQWIPTVATDVTGVINFEGSYKKIYKITFDEAPSYFIFNNGGNGAQTGNLEFVNGSAYWWSDDLDGDASAGAAIDFLLKVENARNTAANFNGHDYSICGIDGQVAANLYTEYAGFSDNVRSYIDRSSTKTYNGKNASGNYDWNEQARGFYDIMQELRTIAINAGKLSPAPFDKALIDDEVFGQNSNTFVIVLLVLSGLTVTTAFFLSKKRKESITLK